MYISVVYKRSGTEDYGGRPYTYKTALPLAVGDKVICPTARGDSPAQVAEINLPDGRIDERWKDIIKEVTEYQEVRDKTAHLCDTCQKCFATCDNGEEGVDFFFCTGLGSDNVYKCKAYLPVQEVQKGADK